MTKFIEHEASPIVSTLLRQGMMPDYSEALTLIDQSELRTSGDAKWALGATGLGVASSCGILALSGVTLPIIIPIGAALGCLATAWNSRQTEIDRIKESEFLGQFPQVLALIESKDSAGATGAHIAAAYDQTFKAYRYGDLDNVERFLTSETQSHPQTATQESTVDPPQAPSSIPTLLEPLPQFGGYPSSTTDFVDVARAQSELATSVVIESFAPVEAELDVAAMLANELYSYAIMSPSGGGKGVLVSNALRLIKKANPAIHIFLVDPKDDPKERGYWTGVVDTWARCNFLDMGSDAKTEFIEGAMARYQAVQGPKMLVFDEGTNIFGHLKNCAKQLFADLKSFLSGIASSGNSRKNYVWLIGHSGNLGDYGISGGEMSCFRKIYIAPMTNIEAVKQLGNTTFAGGKFGDEGVEFIKMIAGQSDVSRAVYVGTIDNWKPMARLVNHSGYNRDTDTVEVEAVAPTTAQEVPTKSEVEYVGRAMHQTLKATAARLTGMYNTADLVLAQMVILLKAGKSREAIALMMPHTHPSRAAFSAEFGESLGFVYDWAMLSVVAV